MINSSVNLYNKNLIQTNDTSAKTLSCNKNSADFRPNRELQTLNTTEKNQNKPSFKSSEGFYRSTSAIDTIKDIAVTITNDFVGLIGVNAALLFLQKYVNGKFLIGKINNHFTKNIPEADYQKLANIAGKVKAKVGNPQILHGPAGEAYYTQLGNKVVVGAENHSAIFHELGHAWQENNTKFLKKLQRGRGRYAEVSMLLYLLMAQRQKSQNSYGFDQNQTLTDKIKNFVSKSDAIVPLLAFSPELITEATASIKGLKLLKEHNKMLKQDSTKIGQALSKSAMKNIKNSYITCFLTYLFVPVSIMMLDALRNSANKAFQKKTQNYSPF